MFLSVYFFDDRRIGKSVSFCNISGVRSAVRFCSDDTEGAFTLALYACNEGIYTNPAGFL